MGPFFLIDLLGLDTVLHVAEHLQRVLRRPLLRPQGMQKLVADGKLGAKTGGEGFYKDGEPHIEGDAEPDGEELAELLRSRRSSRPACVLEEGVCTVREIDLGMMAGAGLDPRRGLFPPFMKADIEGLDVVLEKLESGRGGARRALRAADDPAAPRRPGPPGHEDRPGLLRLPAARRGRPDRHRSSSRRAATWRSPGSPTRR